MYDAGSPKSVLCDNLEGWSGEGSRRVIKREGTHAYLWPIHVAVWQKPSQYCNYPSVKKIFLRNLYHYGNDPRHVDGLAIKQQVHFSS